MKKVPKKILLLTVSILIIFAQWYFIEKPKQKNDDAEIKDAELVRVVDGDTVVLKIDGKNEKIRLIGMDSPESVKPNHPVECFGIEASAHAKEILKNKDLRFKSDYSQDTRDRYGRLLGYIYMYEENFAEKMIFDGYAYEYTYRKNNPYRYQSDFKKAESKARKNRNGLWADDACSE